MMRPFLIIAALAALVLTAQAGFASKGAQASELRVVSVEVENPSRVRDAELLSLFNPKVGDLYTKETVDRSLSLLSHLSGVDTVRVLTRQAGQGLAIKLVVKPVALVREIEFEGLGEIDESEIEVAIYSRVDEPVFGPHLEKDSAYIVERLGEFGYREATASARVVPLEDENWVDIVFTVVEGEARRITALGDMGDMSVVGEATVLGELELRVGSVASLPELGEGVTELEQYCWRNRYPEASVLGERFEYIDGEVLMHAPLALGEYTRITIAGGPEWLRNELKGVLRERFGEKIDEDWLVHAKREMRQVMVDDGYMNATAKYKVEAVEGLREITFEVDTGKRTYLEAVYFEGVEELDQDDLREVMDSLETGFFGGSPEFSREVLDGDMGRLYRYYVSQGFLKAQAAVKEISVTPEGEVFAIVKVEEGPRFLYGKVDITIDTDAIDVEKAIEITEISFGQPANPAALENARINLLAELSKLGYIKASVQVVANPAAGGQRLDVDIVLKSGPRKEFGTIVVSGNARTETEVILRELSFKSGEPWNEAMILLSRQDLFRLGFFQEVMITPLGGVWPDGTQDIIVKVREQNAGYFDFGVGWATEERLHSFFEVGHSNIHGWGRSLSLRVTAGSTENSYAVNYLEPWVFGYPVDFRARFLDKREEQEVYTLNSTAIQVALDHEFNDTVRGSLIYTLEDNELSDVVPGAVLTDEDDEPYLAGAIGPLLIYDSRDDPFNPKSGFYHSIKAEWARTEFASDLEYGRYTGFVSTYLTAEELTLALMARSGVISYFGDTRELPVNKRFFLGGRTTVRGFDRDSIGPEAADGSVIGGDLMLNLKAELRFPIKGEIGGAVFWDGGQVWSRSTDSIDWQSLRHGAGAGFRYNTPVGPISLDIGFKLDREEGEDLTQWHFSIGNVF